MEGESFLSQKIQFKLRNQKKKNFFCLFLKRKGNASLAWQW